MYKPSRRERQTGHKRNCTPHAFGRFFEHLYGTDWRVRRMFWASNQKGRDYHRIICVRVCVRVHKSQFWPASSACPSMLEKATAAESDAAKVNHLDSGFIGFDFVHRNLHSCATLKYPGFPKIQFTVPLWTHMATIYCWQFVALAAWAPQEHCTRAILMNYRLAKYTGNVFRGNRGNQSHYTMQLAGCAEFQIFYIL